MKIKVKLITNTTQELNLNFMIIGIPFEIPYLYYVSLCYNAATVKSELINEMQNTTLELLAVDIRTFLDTFNPISNEVSFSYNEKYDDNILASVADILTLRIVE